MEAGVDAPGQEYRLVQVGAATQSVAASTVRYAHADSRAGGLTSAAFTSKERMTAVGGKKKEYEGKKAKK